MESSTQLHGMQNFVYSSKILLLPIAFIGDSLDALRAFPESVRREAGHQLRTTTSSLRDRGIESS